MSGSCRYVRFRVFPLLVASATLAACGLFQRMPDLSEHCSHDRLFVTSDQVYLTEPEPLCDQATGTCDNLAQAFYTAAVCDNEQTVVLAQGAHYAFTRPLHRSLALSRFDPRAQLERRNRQASLRSGASALPVIANRVIVEGNGATFERAVPVSSALPGFESPFRFFYVAPQGSLTLRNMTLSNGLVYLLTSPSQAEPPGGYTPAGGAILNRGELQLWETTFTGNRVARPGRISGDGSLYRIGDGNAVYNAGQLSMSGGVLDGNAAPVPFGGDLSRWVIDNAGNAQFSAIEVIASRFNRYDGMINNPGGTLAIYRSRLGERVPLINYGRLQVVESLLHAAVISSAGDTLVRNTTIDRAPVGLMCQASRGTTTLTVDSVTVYGSGAFEDDSDTVGIGVTLSPGCRAQFRNTVVTDSTTTDCRVARQDVRVSHAGQSQDSDGSCPGFVTDVALLGELQDNGGPTHTRLPAANSPLVDAGGSVCPPQDQRGQPRADGACDIGAVER